MFDPTRTAAAALAVSLGLASAGCPAPAAARDAASAPAASSRQGQPEAVTQMADWVVATDDNGALPFVIIDKVAAKVFVFRADGQLRGAAPALIGSARGDNSTPGAGDREMSDIPLNERTTPAGRFVASFGSTRGKEQVLWVDYATAIALHPVVTANPKERRLQRLKSPTPRDNHITHGCINVSAAFYAKVVRPAFTGTNGVVYILPEKTALEAVFPAYRLVQAKAPTGDGADAGDLRAAGDADTAGPAHAAPPDATLAR